jgi:hypothetical protein
MSVIPATWRQRSVGLQFEASLDKKLVRLLFQPITGHDGSCHPSYEENINRIALQDDLSINARPYPQNN